VDFILISQDFSESSDIITAPGIIHFTVFGEAGIHQVKIRFDAV
jgi:hypothetical protein